jgi:hypothetical protein
MKRGVSHLDSPAWDIEVSQMPRFRYARTYWCYVLVLQCTPNYEGKAKKVKVKFTLLQPTKAQTGSRGIALLFL